MPKTGMRAVYKEFPVVLKTRCVACGLCGAVCPHDCLAIEDGTGVLVRPEDCTGEGYCVSACVQGAIRMRRVRVAAKTALISDCR